MSLLLVAWATTSTPQAGAPRLPRSNSRVRDPLQNDTNALDSNCFFEIGDVSRASSKIKGELPGKGNEVKKDTEKWGAEAGAKLDNAVRVTFHIQIIFRSFSPEGYISSFLPTYSMKKYSCENTTANHLHAG